MTRNGLRQRGARLVAHALLCACVATTAGCKVVTIQQDQAIRAKRSPNFDAGVYVSRIWDARALPELRRRATSAKDLFMAIGADLDAAGARLGRRASEGGAWTFVVSGEGTVRSFDDSSRRRTIEVLLAGDAARSIKLEVGPVVVGTSLRDALPFIAFDDFSDQLAYADVGRALTTTSLSRLKPALGAIKPGDQIGFVGAFNLPAPGQPIFITPISIEKAPARGAAG